MNIGAGIHRCLVAMLVQEESDKHYPEFLASKRKRAHQTANLNEPITKYSKVSIRLNSKEVNQIMSRYRCEYCNCYLDAGEKCDCLEQSEQLRKKYEQLTIVSNDGQIKLGGICYENSKNQDTQFVRA